MLRNRAGRIRLVVFDVDGTLLRGESVLVTLSRSVGRLDRMLEMEKGHRLSDIKANAQEMASWYLDHGRASVEAGLSLLNVASGADDGFCRLRDAGVETAIVSVTWDFAVEYFANRFRADYHVGSGFDWQTGEINYFVADCKMPWLKDKMDTLDYSSEQVVAVGDSPIDFGMYEVAGSSFHVGTSNPDMDGVEHRPNADISALTEEILALSCKELLRSEWRAATVPNHRRR